MNKIVIILALMAMVSVPNFAMAQELDKDKVNNQLRSLYRDTQENPKKINLMNKGQSLYVNLVKEVEISKRERSGSFSSTGFQNEIKLMKDELTKRLTEIKKLRSELSKDIEKKEESNESLKLLVTVYETIGAAQAADLLKRLPIPVSLKMIKMMNPKKSSKIIAAMEPKVAAEMSRRLIKTSDGKGGQ